jgi:hypothetical protein
LPLWFSIGHVKRNHNNNFNSNSPPVESPSSENSSKEDFIEYMNLNNLTEETTEENSEDIIQEKTSYVYYVDGRKEIEIESYERIEINKEEIEKNEFEKEITISSEEHVEDPLRVYTDLTTEAKKEKIKIYWQNQDNLDITDENEFEVEYYDENDNGLIDRISWIVPHLSTQIFDVVIETNFIENGNTITLITEADTSLNPIKFKINASYNPLSNINCSLEINRTGFGIRSFFRYFNGENLTLGTSDLQNGDYTWRVFCWDKTSPIINNESSDDFTINEEFSISLNEGKVYLLDLTNNSIRNQESILISSTNPSNFSVKLIKNQQSPLLIKNCTGSCSIVMNETLLDVYGIYNLSVEFDKPSSKTSIITNFTVATANLILNSTSIKEGDTIKINVLINSPIKKINPVYLEYGDGTSDFNSTETNQFNKEFTKKYTQNGQYNINLNPTITGLGACQIKKTLTVTDFNDNEDPDITLLWPKDEKVIYEDTVNFSYEAQDNAKLQNCTFKLYGNCASMSYCSTSSSNLDYSTTKINPANNEEIEIKLRDFDEGIYEWMVECYDNSSNYDWEIGFFKINLNGTSIGSSSKNYVQKEEVELLKEQIDEFLGEDFTLEELEVLEDLNILNDTKYYKKRLVDIGDFLSENYKYVQSEELREKKTNEYLAELENIKNKVPKDIFIKESYEFIKNRIDINLEEVIQDYFDSTNTNIGRASIQKLAKVNKELQNGVSVSAKIRNIEMEYNNGTQKITLVKKKIEFDEEDYSKILEIVPKSIAKDSDEIIFITESEVVKKDPIFEMDYEDLDRGQVIYYLNGFSNLKDFEKTETLLFEDDLSKIKARFTGFFVVDFTSSDTALYFIIAFILLIALSFFGIFIFKKFRMLRWRKEPNVVRVMNLIEEIKKLLGEKEIEKARENYYKIKGIYPVLPKETKAYFYEKIGEISIKIDRKDIFGLVKEYQEAKRNWNKEDYMRLYKDIRQIYGRLPEKDRKKVYAIINGY